MFGIITVRGNASGSIKPTRWIVHEARNAEDAWDTIMWASVRGSVGATDSRDETHIGGGVMVLARVQRICDDCGKPAEAYGSCHDDRFARGLEFTHCADCRSPMACRDVATCARRPT